MSEICSANGRALSAVPAQAPRTGHTVPSGFLVYKHARGQPLPAPEPEQQVPLTNTSGVVKTTRTIKSQGLSRDTDELLVLLSLKGSCAPEIYSIGMAAQGPDSTLPHYRQGK